MLDGMTESSVVDAFASVAAQAVRAFAGRNAHVRWSTVVHAVHPERWLGEIRVPAPSCRIGISGFDLGALVATNEPVTCVRCLYHQAGGYPGQPGAEQLTLWPAELVSSSASLPAELEEPIAVELESLPTLELW